MNYDTQKVVKKQKPELHRTAIINKLRQAGITDNNTVTDNGFIWKTSKSKQ